jgi:hypothetical protein
VLVQGAITLGGAKNSKEMIFKVSDTMNKDKVNRIKKQN